MISKGYTLRIENSRIETVEFFLAFFFFLYSFLKNNFFFFNSEIKHITFLELQMFREGIST